ncbi:MAG: hypothetical protein K2X76_01075 [Sphingomonas sp.]|nr:hypothetical protein [Sphingomonas sp.]
MQQHEQRHRQQQDRWHDEEPQARAGPEQQGERETKRGGGAHDGVTSDFVHRRSTPRRQGQGEQPEQQHWQSRQFNGAARGIRAGRLVPTIYMVGGHRCRAIAIA